MVYQMKLTSNLLTNNAFVYEAVTEMTLVAQLFEQTPEQSRR